MDIDCRQGIQTSPQSASTSFIQLAQRGLEDTSEDFSQVNLYRQFGCVSVPSDAGIRNGNRNLSNNRFAPNLGDGKIYGSKEPFLHLGVDRPKLIIKPNSGNSGGVNRMFSRNIGQTFSLCDNGTPRMESSGYISQDLGIPNTLVGAAQSLTAPLPVHLHTLQEHIVTTQVDEHRPFTDMPPSISQPLKGHLPNDPPSEPHHSARETLLLEPHKWNLRAIWFLLWCQNICQSCSRFPAIIIVFSSLVDSASAVPVTVRDIQLPLCLPVTSEGSDSTRIMTTEVKGAGTVLALLSVVLITLTYSILIGASTRLASSSKMPFPSIAQNIRSLLEHAWPDESNSVLNETIVDPKGKLDAIRLFYVGRMGNGKHRVARGLRQCDASPDSTITTPPFWLTTGSPLTASLVQIAIWEWVFLWTNAAMVVATLLYNGNLTSTPGPDSFLRLTVVLIYAVAYLFHAAFIWYSFCRFLTLVAMGSTWSLLNRANFAVVDRPQLQRRLECPDEDISIDFRIIDKATGEFTPGSYSAHFEHEVPSPEMTPVPHVVEAAPGLSALIKSGAHLEDERELRDALGTISKIQERAREICTDAVDAALDRVVVNGMLMVGIIIASGFSTWSTTIPRDIQSGSLALLASLSLGGAAMFTSAVKVTMANSSFMELLHLKEVKINKQSVEYNKKRVSAYRGVGFTYGTVEARAVRPHDLIKITGPVDILLFLIFGPAYSLLPSKADHIRASTGAQFSLTTSIRHAIVVLTTGGTDKHSKDEKGMNMEAINVCYRPIAESNESDSTIGHGSASEPKF